MGSISAMNATGRWTKACGDKIIKQFQTIIGARIEGVFLSTENCYDLKVIIELDNGQCIEGPSVASYEDAGDELVDGIRSDYIEPETVRQLYVQVGYQEHILRD